MKNENEFSKESRIISKENYKIVLKDKEENLYLNKWKGIP